VAKWQNAFAGGANPTVKDDFIDLDSDRFYIQVTDLKAKGKGTITVTVSTKNVVDKPQHPENAKYNNPPVTLTLMEKGKTGVFTSRSLMLVSDKDDDEYPVKLDPKDKKGVPNNQPDDRTFLIALGGTVVVNYGKQITTAKVPVKKTLNLVINVLNDKAKAAGGKATIEKSFVRQKVQTARERYAQLGIDITYTLGKDPIDPPKGVDLTNGYNQGVLIYRKGKLVNKVRPLSATEMALLGSSGRNPASKDIYVYFVNTITGYDEEDGKLNKDPTVVGLSYREIGAHNPRFANFVVMASTLTGKVGGVALPPKPEYYPYALAHELGHLLQTIPWGGDTHSKDPTNLMSPSGPAILTSVTDPKRLSEADATQFFKSRLLQNPKKS
jgi:hypothetical protein